MNIRWLALRNLEGRMKLHSSERFYFGWDGRSAD